MNTADMDDGAGMEDQTAKRLERRRI
jgi:hypothetical protein